MLDTSFSRTVTSGKGNADWQQNESWGQPTADPSERITFAMVDRAVRDYKSLEDAGAIQQGKCTFSEWPKNGTTRGRMANGPLNIRGFHSIAEVTELIEFFSDDSMYGWGFSQGFAVQVRRELGIV